MELQKYFSKFLIKKRKRQLTEREYFLSTELKKVLGTEVQNIALYREAFSLKNSFPDYIRQKAMTPKQT